MRFPVINTVLGFITGIFLQHIIQLKFKHILILSCMCFLFLFVVKILVQKFENHNIWYRVFVIIFSIFLGMSLYHIQNTKNENHITFLPKVNQTIFYTKVNKVLKPSDKFHRIVLEVYATESNKKANGKILAYLPKEEDKEIFIGDKILFYGEVMNIPPPKNPFSFDYGKYLKLKKIYHQIFLRTETYQIIENKENFLFKTLQQIKDKIVENLKSKGFEGNELGVITSLLMGDRNHLSKNLQKDYSNAGAVHILAVSGLHVGIIYTILRFIFSFLRRLKKGNYVLMILLLLLLWSYALFTGLSPSVTRAVTMFSFIAIGKQLKRATNIYNTLALSAFAMVLYNPNYVFDIGFQLSYLAVLSIIFISPILDILWIPKNKIITYFWKITTVSIAVQIGTFPISVYYFHQFPTLFMITNWVILPVILVVLSFGIFIVIISGLKFTIIDFIFEFYAMVIKLMNNFVSCVASFESYLINKINFDLPLMLISYVVVYFLIQTFKYKKTKTIYISLICIFVVLSYKSYRDFYLYKEKEAIIFNAKNSSVLGIKQGSHLKLISTNEIDHRDIIPYKIAKNIKSISYKKHSEKAYILENLNLVTLNGKFSPNEFLKNIPKGKKLWLQQSTNYNLKKLIETSKPKIVIWDSSSSYYQRKNWQNICEGLGVKFYDVKENGFFKISP